MKTKLLWALMLSVGSTAFYFGVTRPEVSTVPKRVQDFLAKDPATLPPVRLPAFKVSESRLPEIPIQPPDSSPRSPVASTEGKISIDAAAGRPDVNGPGRR